MAISNAETLTLRRNRQAETPQPTRPELDTRDLFRGNRTVTIDHEGERYILRLTRNERLILTKEE